MGKRRQKNVQVHLLPHQSNLNIGLKVIPIFDVAVILRVGRMFSPNTYSTSLRHRCEVGQMFRKMFCYYEVLISTNFRRHFEVRFGIVLTFE